MNAISLYCGAGGIDEGLKQCGIKTTLAIDIVKDCCETFKLNHPDTEVIQGPVASYENSLPKVDIVVGGPPCQEFSNANVWKTQDLCEVKRFWSIVDTLNPRYWFMENVPAITKVYSARPFHKVNCADYGVPQTRKRVFFTNLPLPTPTHVGKWVSIREALNLQIIDNPTTTLENLRTRKPYQWAVHKPNHIDLPCKTITTRDTAYPDVFITDGIVARKLRNEERAILQSFPPTYKFFGLKGSVHKQIGNAVPPLVVKSFFSHIGLSLSLSH